MKYVLLSLLVAFVFLGLSCQKRETPVIDINGKEWRLAKWSDSEQNPSDFMITATFKEGNISGKSAVNQYNGPYQLSKNGEFSVGAVVMTRMAGSPIEMKAEQIYHDLLGKAKRIKIDESGLRLQDDTGTELLFFVSK